MRPGQQAPESPRGQVVHGRLDVVASMRPGQQAPESRSIRASNRRNRSCFNEARAASPGIPGSPRDHRGKYRIASMRPGQQAPESHQNGKVGNFPGAASMRPGQQAPESRLPEKKYSMASRASMRPGQQAPESPGGSCRPGFLSPRFNEARAASPGIPRPPDRRAHRERRASMRPGQQAPESRCNQSLTKNTERRLQ